VHAGGGSERDQGDDQGVFHQVLAFFTQEDVLDMREQGGDSVKHGSFPPSEWCGLMLSRPLQPRRAEKRQCPDRNPSDAIRASDQRRVVSPMGRLLSNGMLGN